MHTLVPSHIKIPGFRSKRNIPQNYRGMFYIPGGGRQFHGQLHTTTGNLQENFAIFATKTNFAPRALRVFPGFHKIFPKQITGNLIPQNRENCAFPSQRSRKIFFLTRNIFSCIFGDSWTNCE